MFEFAFSCNSFFPTVVDTVRPEMIKSTRQKCNWAANEGDYLLKNLNIKQDL